MPAKSEVVVHIDNASTPPKSLESIRDQRLSLHCTESKVGFSRGLNLAIAAARSNKILRLDSDDLPIASRWVRQSKQLDKFDAVSGLVFHKFETKRFPYVLPHYPIPLSHHQIRSLLPHLNPMIHPASAFRKDVFEGLGGYGNSLAEDYELWLKFAINDVSMARTTDYVTTYRHHKKQATSQPNWQQLVNDDLTIKALTKRLVEKNISEGLSPHLMDHTPLIMRPFTYWEFRAAPFTKGQLLSSHD